MERPYSLIRSPRRKRSLALQVQPDGTVQVQAPLRTSLKWIESFIASRADWIRKRRDEMAQKTAPLDLTPETPVPLLGDRRPLAHFCPETDGVSDPVQLKTALVLFYKKAARTHLPARMKEWAEKTGLHPSKITTGTARQRWGSCSEKNAIRLNWKLVLCEPDLVDYVIVHELAHILHKDHSARFWACVGGFLPDWKSRRSRLRSVEKDPIHHTLA